MNSCRVTGWLLDVGLQNRPKCAGMTELLLALVVALLLGCAGDRGARRDRPQASPPATIGIDRAKVPRGQVIPPAGLGVDLVSRS